MTADTITPQERRAIRAQFMTALIKNNCARNPELTARLAENFVNALLALEVPAPRPVVSVSEECV